MLLLRLKAAVEHQQNGRSFAAETLYRQIIAALPGCATALNNLALLRPPVEALQLFQQAVAAEPDYVDALVDLSSALQAGAARPGRTDLQARAKAGSGYGAGPVTLGDTLQTQGRHDDAVTQCERAVGLRPDFQRRSAISGTAHFQLKQPEIAAAYSFRALACNPASPSANLTVMPILEADGRLKEAAACRAKPATVLGEAAMAAVAEIGRRLG